MFDKNENKDQLISLFEEYFKEVHGDEYVGNYRLINKMLYDMFIYGKSIYYVEKDGEVIGFIVVYINDQYGMTVPVIVTEYMYVKPEYRSGRAVMLLYAMIGIVCEDYGYNCVSTTFITSANTKNNILVGAKPLAVVNEFKLDRFKSTLNKYKKRIFR